MPSTVGATLCRVCGALLAQAGGQNIAFSEGLPPWRIVVVAAEATPPRVGAHPRYRASFSLRLKAFLIDYVVGLLGIMIAVWIVSLFSQPLTLETLVYTIVGSLGLVVGLNQILLTYLHGQTIGKRALAIKLVTLDGTPLDVWRIIGRHVLGYLISAAPLGFGFLWALWDSDHMAWHDKLFLTSVIRME